MKSLIKFVYDYMNLYELKFKKVISIIIWNEITTVHIDTNVHSIYWVKRKCIEY